MIGEIIFIVVCVVCVVLGIVIGYGIAIRNIYKWMTDILEPVPATPENEEFLWGVIFAQTELDKKITHVKKEE